MLKLVKWFCRQLTYNELASAIIIIHEVLSNSRSDIELKPNAKPFHCRNFRVDMLRPLIKVPEPKILPLLLIEKSLKLNTKRKQENHYLLSAGGKDQYNHRQTVSENTAELHHVICT